MSFPSLTPSISSLRTLMRLRSAREAENMAKATMLRGIMYVRSTGAFLASWVHACAWRAGSSRPEPLRAAGLSRRDRP